MRPAPLLALALTSALAGCASTGYTDTSPAVDADPLCASQPSQPNEPVALRCERKTTTEYTDDRKPLDLKREGQDTPPR